MGFQTFCGIRLDNFAFKFDLRRFLESFDRNIPPIFALEAGFYFFKTKQRWNQGPIPLFSP